MFFSTKRQIKFDPIDPLGDGLGDAIAAERRRPEAFHDLHDMIDPQALSQSWSKILEEARGEPGWFIFAE